MRHKVDYSLVEKRAKCLSSTFNKHDCKVYLERALASTKNDSPTRKSDVDKLFNECMSRINANLYYGYCMQFIADETDSKRANMLTERFIDQILPYVEDAGSWVWQMAPRFNYSHHIESMIIEASHKMAECDRIYNNHVSIQEQFDLDSFVANGKGKGVKRLASKVCDLIYKECTKNNSVQNLSVTLEECSLLFQKHKIDYKPEDLVKQITEYYLLKPNNTDDVHNAYRSVLSENSMISDNDLNSVIYFTELYDASKSNLLMCLNKFVTSTDRDLDRDFGAIIRTAPLGYTINREDFCTTFGQVLTFIREKLLSDDFSIDEIVEIMNTVPANIKSCMDSETWNYTRDDLDAIVMFYTNELEQIEVELADFPDEARTHKLVILKDLYNKAIEELNELRCLVYTNDAVKSCDEMAALIESSHAYYLNEFKVFKFQNLLKTAMDAEKFIKSKGKALLDKIFGKLKPKEKKKKLLSLPIFETITERCTSDICIMSFDILDESEFWQVHDVMSEMCKQLNNNVVKSETARIYYVVNPDTVDIRLEDSETILLTDEEQKEVSESFCYEDKERIVALSSMAELLESIDIEQMENLVGTIESRINEIDEERFSSIIEASQYVDTVSKDDVTKLFNMYQKSHKTPTPSTRRLVENWETAGAPLEIQIEVCDIIDALLESDDEKKKINKEKEKKEEEEKKKSIGDKIRDKGKEIKDKVTNKDGKKKGNPFAGVNLNNLKIYVAGIKAKMKDMSAKEKEWSRNLDMDFNRLYKACHDALISDRREAIIKGSIIPSFSKCIKLGVGIAGLTFINPVAAAVAVIGGVALSKNLTRKERLLLLDEIETELEVVEKEISIAEGQNNMKKYRKLLQYRKDLQRQYQRIRYNERIGKDLLPGSTVGMKELN